MATLAELRKAPHLSASSMSKFMDCQLAWAFRYVHLLEPEHTPVNLVFGRAFHKAATWIAAQRRDGRAYSMKDACAFFSEAFRAECAASRNLALDEGVSEASLDSQGRAMLGCLDAAWPKDERVLETGTVLCAPLRGFDGFMASDRPLICELDMLVEGSDGSKLIVDWKTAARRWPSDKAGRDLQATAYLYAYCAERSLRPDELSFRFDIVTKAKAPAYVQCPTSRRWDDFGRLLWLAHLMDGAARAAVFMPNESSFCCGSCVHSGACREWHRRSRARTIPMAKAS